MKESAGRSPAPFYHIVRTRGRGIRIRVLPSGEVEVLAGPRVSVKKIDAAVHANLNWIETHRPSLRPAAVLEPGGYLLLFGRELPVSFMPDPPCFCDGTQIFLVQDITEKQLIEQLKQQLYPYVFKCVKDICKSIQMNLPYISINGARTRWGSCNRQIGRLNFSYRLVFAAPALIFAVAAHECAHLLHADHSKRFYAALSSIDPKWREHRRALRDFENRYNIYNLID